MFNIPCFRCSKSEGAFFVANAWCRNYGATMETYNPPAFSTNFVNLIQKLNTYSLLYGNLNTTAAEEFFDKRFKEFINTFGTHYIRAVEMGSRLSVITKFNKTDIESYTQKEMEGCVESEIWKGEKGENSAKCKIPNFKVVKVGSEEQTRTKIVITGKPNV